MAAKWETEDDMDRMRRLERVGSIFGGFVSKYFIAHTRRTACILFVLFRGEWINERLATKQNTNHDYVSCQRNRAVLEAA